MGTGVSLRLYSPTIQPIRLSAKRLEATVQFGVRGICLASPTGRGRLAGTNGGLILLADASETRIAATHELATRQANVFQLPVTRRLVGGRTSTVRTAQLRASQPVHSRPINLVVYQGS